MVILLTLIEVLCSQARQIDQLHSILDRTEGFIGTTEQERFDECEEAVNQVLQDIRKFAQQTKVFIVVVQIYICLISTP